MKKKNKKDSELENFGYYNHGKAIRVFTPFLTNLLDLKNHL